MQKRVKPGEIIIGDEERRIINEVLDSGWISEGPKVKDFENEWARFIGTSQAILTNSGTSALIAGLHALRIKYQILPGKKVITTPLTYISTSNAIALTGLKPVYCDVDREKFLIDPEEIKKMLEENNPEDFCGILPVHLMGYACDMDKINSIAKKYGLFVFEDAAQAHGTSYKGRMAGSLSDISDFSFYIAHNIQVGELGSVNSNDPELIRLVRKIKANGRICDCPICTRAKGTCPQRFKNFDPRFTHDVIGYNFKTTEFQAALALAQLKRIDEIIRKRSENVRYLNEHLARHKDLQLPIYDPDVSYLAYPVLTRNRVRLIQELEKRGIETRVLFGCIPTQQPAYTNYAKLYEGKLPNAEYIGRNGLYIGCHQYLSREDLDYVVSVFNEVMER